jgi:hypothetical protein
MNRDPERDRSSDSAQTLAELEKQVDKQAVAFDKRRKRDKRKSYFFRMAAVMLSATITVLLGLQVATEWQDRLANLALVLSALVTVLTAADAFFQHRSLWIARARTTNRLARLEARIRYYKAGLDGKAPDPAHVDGFFGDLERILLEDEQAWLNLRGSTPGADDSELSKSLETS